MTKNSKRVSEWTAQNDAEDWRYKSGFIRQVDGISTHAERNSMAFVVGSFDKIRNVENKVGWEKGVIYREQGRQGYYDIHSN